MAKRAPKTTIRKSATRQPRRSTELLQDVRALIEAAREQTARAVNSALVGLHLHVSSRIRDSALKEKRAEC